ncbi:MAG: type II toxin-antitoxin system VapB family antitoxin [Gaiellaceae bacterium]
MPRHTRAIQTRLHRTTIDIDLEAFGEARDALGTTGYKDTVNAALREVVGRKALLEFAEEIRTGTIPGPTPEELAEIRRPRVS